MQRLRSSTSILLIPVLIALGWQALIIGPPAASAASPQAAPASRSIFIVPTPRPAPTADYTFQPLLLIPFPPTMLDANDPPANEEPSANRNAVAEGAAAPVDPPAETPADESSTALRLAEVPESVINIVLLGTDKRPEWGDWRTDTIIIVSINPEAQSVGMLSIPRDLWIQIPALGVGRINTVDFLGERKGAEGGGPSLLKRTIEVNLGLPIHRYARIDLEGFIQVIDALGGVTIDVECPVHDAFLDEALTGEEGFAQLDLDAGIHHLDGLTALRYARSRRHGSDFDRAQRQQKLLRSLAEQNLNWELIGKLPQLWEALSATVDTDLTLPELIQLTSIGMQIQQDKIKSRLIDWRTTENFVTASGAMVLLPNREKLPQAVEEFLNPPKEDGRLKVENAQIEIHDGTGTAGLAEVAAKRLKRQGFNVTETSESSLHQHSVVIFKTHKPHTLQVLQDVLYLDPDSVIKSPEPTGDADIVVLLGSDWQPCP